MVLRVGDIAQSPSRAEIDHCPRSAGAEKMQKELDTARELAVSAGNSFLSITNATRK